MTTVIIDYGSGNLRSAERAFARMAGELDAGAVTVTSDPEAVRRADRIVLPGVGAFADCKAGLEALPGMREAIEERALRGGVPFLGICVGMQLLATRGLEHGPTDGFDWIPGEVTRLEPGDPALKVPHMGWNELILDAPGHPLLRGIATGDHAYFVHSYHLVPREGAHLLAHAVHGRPLAAAVGRDNIAGTQFHPEKSQRTGLRLIANFLLWRP
ncbi:imidazole glycerol phosphate synthase subunit HisH [Oceanicella actignis]|uniref:Imidazole glycerol phosphate synthase subunit HisH n=1 Tax=Oceanicella actignis TaxID=1189325 RepID=A0A1M7S2R5_9RHOB|nr:imidazole glycerol phosphate synthase subunit HisH [Oceanicella actignis]TYO90204.1 glutamine amidotransferase [Oceanicella actignis]SES89331.1 glutamine amidotransferase [Oceanicella actignis]SHN52907.1 glutamine amidotransferase [Oceanicella actignis]